MDDKRPLLDEGAELVETKKSKEIFSLNPSQMEQIVESYRQRQFDEDILHIHNALKGPEHIAFSCGSHLTQGIKSNTVRQREQFYGHNRNKEIEREGFWNMWLGALDDLMLKILIVAAIVSMVISMLFEEDKFIACIEGGAILVAVAVVSFVTAWNDYKKEE